jgi:hypothetical protein
VVTMTRGIFRQPSNSLTPCPSLASTDGAYAISVNP